MRTAGIWTLAELIRRPSVLTTLRTEIADAMSSLDPPHLSTLLHLPQTELIRLLPQLNAAFQETLRFHTSTYSVRIVMESMTLPAALCGNGIGSETGIGLCEGDEVICVTRKAQVDPAGEWGPTAGVWDHSRFFKDGKKGSMNPFGGGVSMCEGESGATKQS